MPMPRPQKMYKANAQKAASALKANAVSAVRVTVMAVIDASAVVSVPSAARKRLRKVSFLMQINKQPAWNLREALLNL